MPRRLITERTVKDALSAGASHLAVPADALVTALARDTAREHNLALTEGPQRREASFSEHGSPQPDPPPNTLAVGADHAGIDLKPALVAHAEAAGWTVTDVGTHSTDSVDYPDFAYAAARLVHLGQVRFALMIDGVGIGSGMVMNKVPGVRAALCPTVFAAFNARAHNDANALTLGSRTMGVEVCKRVLTEFLTTDFEGGRHDRRVAKIGDVEARFLPGACENCTHSEIS